jgi:hypothetical protein
MSKAKTDGRPAEHAQRVEYEAVQRALAPHFVFESWENGLLQVHPHTDDTFALVRDLDDARFGSCVAEEMRRVGVLYMLAAERIERALGGLKADHKPAGADAKRTNGKALAASK